METLQSVFPLVPVAALERVLDICDQSVEAASDWLLENDWQELVEDEDEQGVAGDEEDADEDAEEDRDVHHDHTNGLPAAAAFHAGAMPRLNGTADGAAMSVFARIQAARAAVASPASSNGEPRGLTMAVSTESAAARGSMHGHTGAAVGGAAAHERTHHHHHRHHGRHGDEYDAVDPDADSEDGDEEEDDEDEDDEDDDEEDDDGDANSYYDSSDESFFHNALPPLTKRVKVTRDDKTANLNTNEHFWVSFDGQVVPKTLIALLNTTLTKLAHSSVLLLKQSSKQVDEDEARRHLKSILLRAEERIAHARERRWNDDHVRSGSMLSRILNASHSDSNPEETIHAGQKRKRADEPSSAAPIGFFAHFFSIADLDMVWRSMLHAHVFNGRFGDLIEFHASATGTNARRDFDELMHIHTNVSTSTRSAAAGAATLSALKCCLLLPCEATEEEIFRVGKHLHTLLKLPGSLYYRSLEVTTVEGTSNNRDSHAEDLLNEDGKLTEDSFRRFARYRIRKEEVEADAKTEKEAGAGPDHFLAYQQPRKVDHCLQFLEKDKWVLRTSG